MNEMQKAYLDGASMAYKDVAVKIMDMIDKAPSEVKSLIEIMRPFAASCRLKADEVYREAERIEKATRQ